MNEIVGFNNKGKLSLYKEVIRIHKLNRAYFVESRAVMNVRGERERQKFQVYYNQSHSDNVTLFYPSLVELKSYKNHHVTAVMNLFNKHFPSYAYSISLYLLDNGVIYFRIIGTKFHPSLSGYFNKAKQEISYTSSNDGLSFFRANIYDMLKEISGAYPNEIKYTIRNNWAKYVVN